MPFVRAVYLVPSDREINENAPAAIAGALVHLRSWYYRQLGAGRAFRLYEPVVETVRTPHASDWYADNRRAEDERFWFFRNVTEDAFDLTGGRFDDPDFVWVYYIDASPKGVQYGGSATSGVAVLHRDDIQGLLGENLEPVSRWVGGLGHELGHAFGLDHPPEKNKFSLAQLFSGRSGSLMMHGFRNFPDTHLLQEDKKILRESHFFVGD